jgi:adenylosuccinate lyase
MNEIRIPNEYRLQRRLDVEAALALKAMVQEHERDMGAWMSVPHFEFRNRH